MYITPFIALKDGHRMESIVERNVHKLFSNLWPHCCFTFFSYIFAHIYTCNDRWTYFFQKGSIGALFIAPTFICVEKEKFMMKFFFSKISVDDMNKLVTHTESMEVLTTERTKLFSSRVYTYFFLAAARITKNWSFIFRSRGVLWNLLIHLHDLDKNPTNVTTRDLFVNYTISI